jgi:hypothetical protein
VFRSKSQNEGNDSDEPFSSLRKALKASRPRGCAHLAHPLERASRPSHSPLEISHFRRVNRVCMTPKGALAHPTPRRAVCLMAYRGRPLEDGDPRHGTANGYNNHGCDCDRCRDAWAARQRDYMAANPEQRERKRKRDRERYPRAAKAGGVTLYATVRYGPRGRARRRSTRPRGCGMSSPETTTRG